MRTFTHSIDRGRAFVAIFISTGFLYALALSGVKTLGAVTPIGGIALLIAWLVVAWTVATG